jgi:hypothetical protein
VALSGRFDAAGELSLIYMPPVVPCSRLISSQFVLALGNRPKGEKFLYFISLWSVILKLCALYMLLH